MLFFKCWIRLAASSSISLLGMRRKLLKVLKCVAAQELSGARNVG